MAEDGAGVLEEILLGGPRTYTRHELAQRSGIPLEYSRRLWRAMGFADVGDDERVFTEGDLAALLSLKELAATGLVDEATALTSTRAMGQQLSRLAEWQVAILTERLVALGPGDQVDIDRVVAEVAEGVLPDLERMLVLVWRRQLAVHGPRALAAATSDGAEGACVVGFADLVNYTRLSRDVANEELAALLEDFEDRATTLLAQLGGRLVKTLGDEVLFVADSVPDGAEIALQLVEAHEAADDLPSLRAGLAAGTVLSRLGDVYGEPVNLASRLTSLARPGTVLVDREVAAALADDSRYRLRQIARQRVRGYRNLEASVLRRSDEDGEQ